MSDTVMSKLAAYDYDIASRLIRSGGIRAIFDRYSAEYSGLDMDARIGFLEAFCRAGVSFDKLQDLLVEAMVAHGYSARQSMISFAETVSHLLERLVADRLKSPLQHLAEQAE